MSHEHFAGVRLHRACTAALVCLLALASCQAPGHLSDGFLRLYAKPNPSHSSFYQCHGFGCTIVSRIELSEAEWRSVRAKFQPPPADASEERRRIAEAVALLQRLVGARTGTSAHQWTRQDYHLRPNPSIDPTQMDCIDESVNTWTYLTMVARDGLLRDHAVEKLAFAGGLSDFSLDPPRNAAVIRAIGSGRYFAIDPTLVDAGETPPIFPLEVWLASWPPPMSAQD
ncbi:MAG TPA: hypothetical protein VN802_10680 [Stellaceae bacterium]|nr:hypothetical protein [Stellaceae bacterium]